MRRSRRPKSTPRWIAQGCSKPTAPRIRAGDETGRARGKPDSNALYIPMDLPILDDAHWDAEVAKMIKAFGAPIDPADAKTIGDYLKQNYGG
jgi:hypothetical protein